MTAAATKVSTTVNHAGVRTIALDDPDRRNALSTELLDDLIDAPPADVVSPASETTVGDACGGDGL